MKNLIFNPDIFSAIAYISAALLAIENPILFTAAIFGFLSGISLSSLNAWLKQAESTKGAPRLWFVIANLIAVSGAAFLMSLPLIGANLFYAAGNLSVYFQSLRRRNLSFRAGLGQDVFKRVIQK